MFFILLLTLVTNTLAQFTAPVTAAPFKNTTSTSSATSVSSTRPHLSLVTGTLGHPGSISFGPSSSSSTSPAQNISHASIPSSLSGACCFLVQDTVSEVWWQMTSYSTSYTYANVTLYTKHVDKATNKTLSIDTNYYMLNTSVLYTRPWGQNPITIPANRRPTAEQTDYLLTGTAVTTGGVVVQSPAAFYVYNYIKIITVDPVRASHGQPICATPSQNGNFTYASVNPYAEGYFGGTDIVDLDVVPTETSSMVIESPTTISSGSSMITSTATETFTITQNSIVFLDSSGETIIHDTPSGTVISLTTPFIFAPAAGADGATTTRPCRSAGGDDIAYGYIPDALVHYLRHNDYYREMYPILTSCIGGGPSITFPFCLENTRTSISIAPTAPPQIPIGGDLVQETVVYVTPNGPIQTVPGGGGSGDPGNTGPFNAATPIFPDNGGQPPNTGLVGGLPTLLGQPEVTAGPGQDFTVPPGNGQTQENGHTQGNGNNGGDFTVQNTGQAFMMPSNVQPTAGPGGNGQPTQGAGNPDQGLFTVPPAFTVPPQASQSPGGQDTPNGNPPPPAGQNSNQTPPAQTDPGIGQIIASILGIPIPTPSPSPAAVQTPVVVPPGGTTIPIASAPPGAVGQSTNIDGTPLLIIPAATTIVSAVQQQPVTFAGATAEPVANLPPGVVGQTTNIGGTPFVIIPGATTIQPANTPTPAGEPVVILGPTAILLSVAPPGAVGSTTNIGGTPFIIIPAATTIAPVGITPAPQPIVITAATSIPLSVAPPGAVGSTTLINGTPFLVIPEPTTIQPPGPFATSVINGTPVLVIPGATTIPLSQAPPGLVGSTTTINGTPFLVVPGATKVPAPTAAGPFATTTINGTPFLVIPSATSIPLSNAPPGLVGSTTLINGTPFIVIPGATTVPAQSTGPFSMTVINGTPFIIIPSSTSLPLSLVPPGVSGSTTIISGTPYLVIPGATIAPLITAPPGGIISVISGTTDLILTGTGLATIPVNPSFSLSGQTTVISGTTMVVVSGGTTVPLTKTGSSTSLSGTSGAMRPAPTMTTSKKNGAEATGVAKVMGAVLGGLVGVVVVL